MGLSELQFGRWRNAVLLAGKERIEGYRRLNQTVRDSESDAQTLSDIEKYDASCCWKVSPKGFERYAPGDSVHGESQTRFVHSLGAVTKTIFAENRLPSQKWKALILSNHEESPLITTLVNCLRLVQVFHKIGEKYVDVSRLRRSLEKADMLCEDLVLLHALAGNSICPSTQHVSQKTYLESYFRWRENIGETKWTLFDRELILALPRDELMQTERSILFETLIAAAFLMKNEGTEFARKKMLLQLHRNKLGWAHEVRKMIAMKPGIKDPSMLMPERADLELQARRAIWQLNYWLQASSGNCNRESAGGLSEYWGFKPYGYPLCERPRDVQWRENIIKNSVKTCKCRSGCRTKRCGCRNRTIPSLCLVCDCAENCENRGYASDSDLSKPQSEQEGDRRPVMEPPLFTVLHNHSQPRPASSSTGTQIVSMATADAEEQSNSRDGCREQGSFASGTTGVLKTSKLVHEGGDIVQASGEASILKDSGKTNREKLESEEVYEDDSDSDSDDSDDPEDPESDNDSLDDRR